MRKLLQGVLFSLSIAVVPVAAFAEPAAESKAGTGIENRALTGEGTTFKAGETVYVASTVTGAEGEKLLHVWKRDGKELRRATLRIQGARWRTSSKYSSAPAGSYVVEIMVGEKKLGEVAFQIQ